MSQTYKNAAAFRQALEARLRTIAHERGVQIQGLRLKLAIERLLARLFHSPDQPWLLKGGYSMELRFRPKARTTRDVDLSVGDAAAPGTLKRRLAEIHEALQIAAAQPLDDFFEFAIEPARAEIQAAPGGGGVFGVIAKMDGRDFARFHLDMGFGDSLIGSVESLEGDNLLEFAGIPPARASAIPKEQQFAEKLHAYSYRWSDRENKRSKDLVDLVVLIERGGLDIASVRHALIETFRRRQRHPLPSSLEPPPDSWRAEFPAMATEAGASTPDIAAAFEVLLTFWQSNSLGATGGQ